MKVAIIILNWNGRADTLECLTSLKKLVATGWEHVIAVADQASTDGSIEAIRAQFPDVIIRPFKKNIGFAAGNNQMIAWAREQQFDAVILLNNDTVVDPFAFDILVTAWSKNKQVGAVMPLFYYYNSEAVWYAGGRFIRPWGRPQHTVVSAGAEYASELFTACCVLLSMEALEKVGLFDERYYLYLEDTDLALRLQNAGYTCMVEPEAKVWHKVSRSSGGSVSPNALYYQVRNNILLLHDHVAWPGRLLGYLYVVSLTGKIGINTFTRRTSRRWQIIQSLAGAWRDASANRWGGRG